MSSRTPNYQIRPSKHVERKIFIETFQHLRSAGYNISDYHYIGFGCFYYIDFILFNKLLSIEQMTCLENKDEIKNRMDFNKPFQFIDLYIDDFSNYITNIKSDKKYLVWLDYESQLNKEILDDIKLLINTLMNGSILIVTVNADLKLVQNTGLINAKIVRKMQKEQVSNLSEYFEQKLKPSCGEVKKSDITPAGLPKLFVRSIQEKIKSAFTGRPDDTFFQIFNYLYKDGPRMLTLGGIIDKADKGSQIKNSLKNLNYINYNDEPKKISIPPLTTREKLLLDQKIKKDKLITGDLPFELEEKELNDYIKYARHYPSFHEVFMS